MGLRVRFTNSDACLFKYSASKRCYYSDTLQKFRLNQVHCKINSPGIESQVSLVSRDLRVSSA